jgi:hypothetical protein
MSLDRRADLVGAAWLRTVRAGREDDAVFTVELRDAVAVRWNAAAQNVRAICQGGLN